MPKTFTVHLPIATERELRYTRVERMEFEKRFRHFGLPGMKDILAEKVFPVKPDPQNDNKAQYTGGGDLEAQYVLVWLGIRHHAPKVITEERVAEWLDLAITQEKDRPLPIFLAAAVNAVLASGVLGFVHEGTAVEEVAEGEEGKAESPASQSSTAT